ncbi:MAG TPA: hypothetical protein VHO94_02535 [Oscillospiraceae bacterium]|nr:hypothetical protein [Oscillospiraceae bacterium]
MKFNKKEFLKDALILIIPVALILILTPILPNQISIHRGLNNQYIDKKYAFLLGLLPFAIYKMKYSKK